MTSTSFNQFERYLVFSNECLEIGYTLAVPKFTVHHSVHQLTNRGRVISVVFNFSARFSDLFSGAIGGSRGQSKTVLTRLKYYV